MWWTVAITAIILGWLLKRACLAANQVDWGASWLNHLDGLNRLFCKYYHRLQYQPIPLPSQGPAIIMANHISGLDPFLLLAATQRPIHFLMAREQYERLGLTWLFRAAGCIPVDRDTHPEVALRAALRELQAGKVIALFPQGKIVLPGEPSKLKRGGFWLAQLTHSPIYPVSISGVRGAGEILRGLCWRSRAKLVSYPPIYWSETRKPAEVQVLLERV